MRVAFAGGGTGGHIYLEIALARELLRRDPSCELRFVGTRQGLESRIVPESGFRLDVIASAGLKGMGPLRLLRNLLLVPVSLWQSRRLLRAFGPDVAVGVGGYSSGPVILAAWALGRATMIVEPNAHPGLTNRWLARFIDRAALALPDTGKHFGGKAVVTGIPVRAEFQQLSRTERQPGRLTLLVYGGSQGSHALNAILCEALADLKTMAASLRLIHQTGEREFEWVRKAYDAAGVAADVRPFLPRIYEELAAADLILCRAGAGTIAELTTAGKAAILVPFPHAADDHQTKNARALEAFGAAKMICQAEWKPGRLALEIQHFIAHPEELDRMGKAARALAKPDATERIAQLIVDLAATRTASRGAARGVATQS